MAELTGYTKRQIQRLATAGQIPGAARTDGGHWRIPDSKGVQEWCHAIKRTRVLSTVPKRAGHDNYVPHLTRLLTVLRKTVPQMTEDQRAALRDDLLQIEKVAKP